jgi:transposase
MGYVLHRELRNRGIRCEVVAPALIPKKPGDRRKTDKIDARELAHHYRNSSLTMVVVPDREDEAVRSLVRLREDLVNDLTRTKHRTRCHLLRNGLAYRHGVNWTKTHRDWLGGLQLELPDEQFVLEKLLEKLDTLNAELGEIDERIETRAFSESYVDRVARIRCLKGFATTTAMTMVSEVGDFTRFPTARHFMSFMGVIPGVWESGGTRRSGIGITKAGNAHCRRVLIQAALSIVQHHPTAGRTLRERWKGQPACVVRHAQKTMKRIHARYWSLINRGKLQQKAIVAVARELAGFVWAIMQSEDFLRVQKVA